MSKKGFAAIDRERHLAICSMGGKAAHAQGKAHQFQAGSELARAAGRKGGLAMQAKWHAEREERLAEG